MTLGNIRIGTAGWTLPRAHAEHFPAEGSHLQRYCGALSCAEVNSSFHKPHRRSTWERWAQSTPDDFRFAVKMPKRITHEAKLQEAGALLLPFFEEIAGLNAGPHPKLGPLLVQLPPKLAFDEGVVREFLGTVRELHSGSVVVEPRHASWFTGAADSLLREFDAARVAADPSKGSPLAAEPGGSGALRYRRLHGSPRTYYSEYDDAFLIALAAQLQFEASHDAETESWVIFDNTALGHAAANALRLQELLQADGNKPQAIV
jgi:uncharacterized protein YecE (DUF72 family)